MPQKSAFPLPNWGEGLHFVEKLFFQNMNLAEASKVRKSMTPQTFDPAAVGSGHEQVNITVDELDQILRLQLTLMEALAAERVDSDVLDRLCSMAESLLDGSVASVMLLDPHVGKMNVIAGPNIPQEAKERLNGLVPGAASGSCGTAVFNNVPTFVRDTFTDERWRTLRSVAEDFNICSCWSMPIRDQAGKAIGSFALSSFEHRVPSSFHKRLLEVGAVIISIYLGKEQQRLAVEKSHYQLIEALERDSVTGLPNAAKLAHCLNTLPPPNNLLILNINNFSYINSAYGWEFGNVLLQKVAEALGHIAQAETYRLQGDEFALLYSGDGVDFTQEIKTLRNYFFEHSLSVNGISFHITCNYGAASGAGIFDKSRIALIKAKRAGKNHHYIYSEQADEPEREERMAYMHWSLVLHEALGKDAITPVFQGIRNNRTGKIDRYEALARIRCKGELLAPKLFLDVARLSGLLPSITRRMIDKSCQIMANYSEPFSINITEDDLSQGYLLRYLERKTSEYGIDPERLMLEILEGVSSTGKKEHIEQLAELKQAGYKLAIDDFGTEYSNFERIIALKVDCVKIDAKYIRDIATNPTSYEVARAIAYFASNVGIETVAEYVHDDEVQSIVEQLGIDYSQGYFYSEPEEK